MAIPARSSVIQVIQRSAAILRACRDLGPNLSLNDIAQQVGLPRSTVQRIVLSLTHEGLLQTNGKSSSIRIGPEALSFSSLAGVDMMAIAQPFLNRLAEATRETVDLARLHRDHMVFINQISGSHRLRTVSAVGEAFPLHCTANGKAALALMTEKELSLSCPKRLTPLTSATIVSHRQLQAELKTIRRDGYALDQEEHTHGICAVGVAIRDPMGAIYAISIPVPSIRFRDSLDFFASNLVRCKEAVTTSLTAAAL